MNMHASLSTHMPLELPTSFVVGDDADAELIEIGRKIKALGIEIKANNLVSNAFVGKANAVYGDVPATLTVTADDCAWFKPKLVTLEVGTKWWASFALEATPVTAAREARVRAHELKAAAKSHLARYKKWKIESGCEANEREYTKLSNELDDLYRRALTIPAKTIAGFIVQARIVRAESSLWRDHGKELDTEEQGIIHIIDSLLALAGGEQ